MRRVLLTGAAGFVGSHVLRRVLDETDWDVVCPISMRHHGNTDAISDLFPNDRVSTFYADLACGIPRTTQFGEIDYIFNIGSGSGVEESIAQPVEFIRNNVELMSHMLELARQVQPEVFLHMGTDEEYGPAAPGHAHVEWDVILPSNPYSASKAAQSALAIAYWRTYKVPMVLTRTMNLIGPGQSSEKLVPTVIRKVLAGETVPIYASPEGVPGSRHWIDVREFGDAWLFLVNIKPEMWADGDQRPSMWHIVGHEMSNLDLAQAIADTIGKPLRYDLVNFHAPRPGHDLRYALDGTKLAAAGWAPMRTIEETITDTVEWYLTNRNWL